VAISMCRNWTLIFKGCSKHNCLRIIIKITTYCNAQTYLCGHAIGLANCCRPPALKMDS
jgi:hypothetical protein